jgi:hypothetical protein
MVVVVVIMMMMMMINPHGVHLTKCKDIIFVYAM